jgi:ABC-type bacteriocin/lantibiotic exporter with double-glycine peptidase domain
VTRRYEQIAETLGAGPWRVFSTVTLPLASRNILAGALLGFSRALGEFGATIVVAGSIPGRTRTLAVGIYTFTETGQDERAAALLVISMASPSRRSSSRIDSRASRRMSSFDLAFTLEQGTFSAAIDITVDARSIALVGPSGSGKTSVLEAIAGLRTPSRGRIAINGTRSSTRRRIRIFRHGPGESATCRRMCCCSRISTCTAISPMPHRPSAKTMRSPRSWI